MSKPPATTYRDTEDEDDDGDLDDLDDLDDVLANFSKPPPTAIPAHDDSQPEAGPSRPHLRSASVDEPEEAEDFDASLVEGMESLLRQLAGENPPGPMPDVKASARSVNADTGVADGAGDPGGRSGMTPEEEEAEFQRALEMMLSPEGLRALGMDSPLSTSTMALSKSKPNENAQAGPSRPPPSPDPKSFEETMRQTMETLRSAGANARRQPDEDGDDLANLLKKLGDTKLAEDGEEDGELDGLLDGMMNQLMTREVLEEPMAELASKYPTYLANPPASAKVDALERYRKQSTIVNQILQTFRKPGFSDETNGREIARLVGEMQDLGGPPEEIMGELPEGLDLGALGLGGEEGCCIM